MSNGALYTCGNPANGRLGLSLVTQMAAVQDMNVDEMPPITTPHLVEACTPQLSVPYSQYITYVTCGDAHTLAITLVGELKAWGANAHGQLGVGDRCACFDASGHRSAVDMVRACAAVSIGLMRSVSHNTEVLHDDG